MGIIYWILIIHFVGDFLLQTDWQAKNKSTSLEALTYHVLVYSTTISVLSIPYLTNSRQFLALFIITAVAHFITDAVTSRIVKKYFAKEDHHNGFVVIGFDQALHYIQLILTFKLILI